MTSEFVLSALQLRDKMLSEAPLTFGGWKSGARGSKM